MKDERKTKKQLIAELTELRRRVTQLEAAALKHKLADEPRHPLPESTLDGVVSIDLDGKITECNQALADMLGYKCRSLEGRAYKKIVSSRWHDHSDGIFTEVLERGYSYEYEAEYVRKNKTTLPVALRSWRIEDEEGHPIGTWSIVRDITERKRVEDNLRRYSESLEALIEDKTRTLRESGESFRALAENADDGILIGTGDDGAYNYANRRAAEITGFSVDELTKRRIKDLVPPDEYKKIIKGYRTKLSGGHAPRQYETTIINNDGNPVSVELTTAPTTWHGQSAVMAIVRDITVRKRAERALQESEEKFRLLAEQSPNMIFINQKGRIVYVNPRCQKVTGYTRDELCAPGFDFMTLIAPDDRDLVKAKFAQHTQGKEVTPYEYRLITKENQTVDVILSSRLIDYEGKKAILGTITDITEQKQAERALRESESMYRTLVETSPEAVTATDLEGKITFVSPRAVEAYGADSADDMIGLNALDIIAPQDRERAATNMQRTLQEGVVRNIEYTLMRKNGSRYQVELNSALLRDADGNPRGFIATTRDITVRKQAQEALRESEERLHLAMETTSDGLFDWNQQTNEAYFSPRWFTMLGYEPGEFPPSVETWLNLLHPDDKPHILDLFAEYTKTRTDHELEFRMRTKSGAWRWVLSRGKMIERAEDGSPGRLLGTHVDITERKQAEETLRREQNLLSRIMEASPAGITVLDREGRITFANARAEDVLGLSRDEITQRAYNAPEWHITDYEGKPFPDEGLPFERVMTTGEPLDGVRHAIEWPDGQRVLLSVNGTPILDEQGQVNGVITTVQDITDQIQAEETLRALTARDEAILAAIPDIIVEVDSERKYTWANQAGIEFFGPDMMGKEASDFFAGDQDTYQVTQSLFDGDESIVYVESWQRRQDGEPRLLAWWCRGLKDAQGNVTGTLSTARDITEQRQAEQALQEYTKRLGVLHEIDQSILEARQPEEIALAALQRVQQLLPCDSASVAAFDRQAQQATILATHPGGSQLGPGAVIPLAPFGEILDPLQKGEPYLSSDLSRIENPPPLIQQQQAHGVRAFLCVPLTAQGEMIGALNLSARTPAAFGPEQSEVARELANQLAIAIQQARLNAQIQRHAGDLEQRVADRTRDLERRTAQLQAAAQVARDATTARDLEDLLNLAVNLIRDRFGFYHAGIFFVDEPREYAVLKAATGEAGEQMLANGHRLAIGKEGIVGHVAASGKPRVALDVDDDVAHWDNPLLPDTRSEMALPLVANEQVIGVLNVQSTEEAAFGDDDVATLQIMADQLAVSIEKVRLFEHIQATLEEQLHTIVANAPIILFALDQDGVYTLSEGKGLAAMGFQPGEHVGQSIRDVYKNFPQVLEMLERAYAGESLNTTVQLGPALFEVWYTPTRDEQGEVDGVIGVATDVTKRRQIEEALQESEATLSSLLQAAPIGIGLVTEHALRWTNEQVGRMTGYSQQELIGLPTRTLYENDEVYEHADRIKHQEIKSRGSATVETRWRHKDGHVIDVMLSSSAVRPGDPSAGIIFTAQDITERNRLERQIQHQERLAAIGQLAGGIAHDFNNFLTSIMLYAQLLLGKPNMAPDVASNVDVILSESRRAAELVRQVLDFSRRSMIEAQPVSLSACIQEIVDMLGHTLPENIRLLVEVSGDGCVINADPTRIQQVIMNLVVNARDAMPQGGKLRIKLSPTTVRVGEIPPVADMPPGEWACLTISDTGTGMSDEVRAHLFEPFFTTKEPGKGTGLGLAQVHGIVKQHDGYIDVQTEVGTGTTFQIYLPRHGEEAEKRAPEPTTLPRGAGETILLVEDEESVRIAASEILKSLGYHVLTAVNGKQALEIHSSAERIDLVITDLVMPEMGGKDLIETLLKSSPDLKTIVITGYSLNEELQDLRDEGITRIITKPLELHTLAEAVRRVLEDS